MTSIHASSRAGNSQRLDSVRPLAELADLIRETTTPAPGDIRPYVALENIGSGDVRIQGWSEASTARSDKFVFAAGDVLYGKLRPYLDKAALAGFDGVASTDFLVLRPREDIDPRFLAFTMHTPPVIQHAKATTAGVNHPRTSWAALKELKVFVPELHEQRQIAQALMAVHEAREANMALLHATQELKKSIVSEIFQGLLPIGKATLSSPRLPTPIGELPKDWAVLNCKTLCETLSVGIVVRPTQYYVDDGVPALRSLNVREDVLDLSNLVYIRPDAHETVVRKSALTPGDVVIVRTGYPGTSAVIPATLPTANCIDLVFARPGRRIRAAYLSRFFNSPAGRRQALANKTGLAQQHLNVGAVAAMLVPVPPLAVQDETVEILEAVDARMRVLKTRQASIDQVFSSGLQHLLCQKAPQ